MGTLFDLLPLLKGWEYNVVDKDNVTVPAGGSLDVAFAEKEFGWILSASLAVLGANGGTTRVSVRMDDWTLDTTIESLQSGGLIQRGVMTPYVSRYDTVLNYYQAMFEFAYPIPYKTFLRLSLDAPSQNPITVFSAVATVRIKPDPPGFREVFEKSLKEVLGTAKIPPGKITPPG